MSGAASSEVNARIKDREVFAEKERVAERQLASGAGLNASLVALAREIAQDIEPIETVLYRHGYEGGQADPAWAELNARPEWRRLLAQQIAEWSAADSTKRRVVLKAQAALEQSLPAVFAINQNPNAREQDRLKAAELLARFGGVGTESAAAGGGGGMTFSLKIALSGGRTINVIDEKGNGVGTQEAAPEESITLNLTAPSFLVGPGQPISDEDDS